MAGRPNILVDHLTVRGVFGDNVLQRRRLVIRRGSAGDPGAYRRVAWIRRWDASTCSNKVNSFTGRRVLLDRFKVNSMALVVAGAVVRRLDVLLGEYPLSDGVARLVCGWCRVGFGWSG